MATIQYITTSTPTITTTSTSTMTATSTPTITATSTPTITDASTIIPSSNDALVIINHTEQAKTMTMNAKGSISVIVPCVSYHAHLLKNLLTILTYQTYLPKEVIVSLSSIRKMSEKQLEKIRQLETKQYPFVLKILYHQEDIWAAGNKNRAAAVATGDILVVQDADDIPHIKRLEVIRYFFKNHDIIHLCHGYTMRYLPYLIKHNIYKTLPFNRKPVIMKNIMYMFCNEENRRTIRITNGEMAIKRSVWLNHKWNETRQIAEDTNYNRFIERKYEKTIYLNYCLMIYNKAL